MVVFFGVKTNQKKIRKKEKKSAPMVVVGSFPWAYLIARLPLDWMQLHLPLV